MTARFQRLFCAGCFAVVLVALPGALREVRQALGGPYGALPGTPSPAAVVEFMERAAPAPVPVPATATTTTTATTIATTSAITSDALRALSFAAVPSPAMPRELSAVAPRRPDLFRDGLARPGI